MLHGRDIVCFSSIDWHGLWQGHQEIMSRLAAAGNKVLFVEHTGARRAELRDVPRLARRLSNWRRSIASADATNQNPSILSPLALPFPYASAAVSANAAIVGRQLFNAIARLELRDPIAWVFLPTPLVSRLLGMLQPSITVYHCVDDFSSSSAAASAIQLSEASVMRDADLIFVTSEGLKQKALRFNPRVHLFPSGVNFERFEAARLNPAERPADLPDVSSTVAIYVGNLHQWVDVELLAKAAAALPEVTFAMLGPISADTGNLRDLPNVRFLGAKPHESIPQYLLASQVALIPYRQTEYTSHVFPAKLNEYLATGIPVVSSDLPEIRRYCERYGDVVELAATPEAFIAAIGRALKERDAASVSKRIDAARRNGWTERLDQMCDAIAAAA